VTDVAAGKPASSSRTTWIDAQLPPALARWLQTEHGTDALHVEELGLHRARDSEIFAAARAATGPVAVVTKDDDFAKLLDRHGPPPQVVLLRCGNVTNRELRRIVLEAWPRALDLLAAGEALVEIRRRSAPAAESSTASS
jgi:predicted nuclease of predicted toxin-antitoxin system